MNECNRNHEIAHIKMKIFHYLLLPVLFIFSSPQLSSSQPDVTTEISTPILDREIAAALTGRSSREQLDRIIAERKRQSIPDDISQLNSSMLQEAYTQSLSNLLKNKRTFAYLALQLHSDDWSNLRTIKKASLLKRAIDSLFQKRLFDHSSHNRINQRYLSRIQAISNFRPERGKRWLYYLDVNEETLPTKRELLVFNSSTFTFQQIENPEYNRPSLLDFFRARKTPREEQLASNSRRNNAPGTRPVETQHVQQNDQTVLPYRVHIYLSPSAIPSQSNEQLGNSINELAISFQEHSDVVIVMNATAINSMRQYMRQFSHQAIKYEPHNVSHHPMKAILYENKGFKRNGDPKLHNIFTCPRPPATKSPRECINDINQALRERISSVRH